MFPAQDHNETIGPLKDQVVRMKMQTPSPSSDENEQNSNNIKNQLDSIVGGRSEERTSTDEEREELKLPELPKSLRKDTVGTTLEFMVCIVFSTKINDFCGR